MVESAAIYPQPEASGTTRRVPHRIDSALISLPFALLSTEVTCQNICLMPGATFGMIVSAAMPRNRPHVLSEIPSVDI